MAAHRDMIKIKDVEPGSKGCEECLKSGRQMGSPENLSDLRACGLL